MYCIINADSTLSLFKNEIANSRPVSILEVDDNGYYYKYYNQDGSADFAKIQEEEDNRIYEEWKVQREEKVANIVVDYNGVLYDGDEKSQDRMSRAILTLNTLEKTYWVSHDNSVHLVSKSELQDILRLAGEEQTRLWNEGRPQ